MTAYPDCFALMCWAGNQSGSTPSSISLEGVATADCPVTPEGVGVWRYLAVDKFSQVELRGEAGHTEPRSRRQTCIDEVGFDADAQAEEDPQ